MELSGFDAARLLLAEDTNAYFVIFFYDTASFELKWNLLYSLDAFPPPDLLFA